MEEEKKRMKNKKSLSDGVCRRFLLISIRSEGIALSLSPHEIQRLLRDAFECRSILIAKEEERNRCEKDFGYLIGLHTENASKHTFQKKVRALFPEIAPENIHSCAKKGIGGLVRIFSTTKVVLLLSSGELAAPQRLEQLASGVKQKRKLAPVTTPPANRKRTPQKKGRRAPKNITKRYFVWSYVKKLVFFLGSMVYEVCKYICKRIFILILSFLFWVYLYIFK